MTRRRITLERTYKTTLAELWDLWTTKDGIESWWGPEGFRVEVDKLDVRVGGELVYWMIAATLEMESFMASAGMPNRTAARIRYTEVARGERLAYLHACDFIPNVPTYDVASVVDFRAVGAEVQLRLSFDPMHDDLWTQRQQQGWESELGKLGKVLAR
jgi:uncharacterized protein YndB with AHSA1/START domain